MGIYERFMTLPPKQDRSNEIRVTAKGASKIIGEWPSESTYERVNGNDLGGYFMPTLPTWAGRSKFSYSGSVTQGTTITYGKGFSLPVSPAQYNALLNHF